MRAQMRDPGKVERVSASPLAAAGRTGSRSGTDPSCPASAVRPCVCWQSLLMIQISAKLLLPGCENFAINAMQKRRNKNYPNLGNDGLAEPCTLPPGYTQYLSGPAKNVDAYADEYIGLVVGTQKWRRVCRSIHRRLPKTKAANGGNVCPVQGY